MQLLLFYRGHFFLKLRLFINVLIGFLFFSALLSVHFSFGQCAAIAGPNTPGSGTDQAFSGSSYAFSNPSNVTVADGSYAAASATLSLLVGKTDYLYATNFGFNLPTAVTICGITVNVKKYATGLNILTSVKDYTVNLLKNGSIVGSNRASGSGWPGSLTWTTYGSSADLWGTGWFPSDVNSTDFGVSVSANIAGVLSLLPTVNIDNITITINYDNSSVLALKENSFAVQATPAGTVETSWSGDDVERNTIFTVQRSADGYNWNVMDTTVNDGENTSSKKYKYTDMHPLAGNSFYRLAVQAPGEPLFYSAQQSVNIAPVAGITIYPNPASSYIIIRNAGVKNGVTITDVSGRECIKVNGSIASDNYQVNINELTPGMYFVKVNNSMLSFLKK